MRHLVETLLPVILVIGAGAVLSKLGMLPELLINGMNRLVYFVGLPALVVRSLANAEGFASGSLSIAMALFCVTTIMVPIAAVVASAIRLPKACWGTLIQGAFRGNLAYIGIPILVFAHSHLPASERNALIATAVIVFAPTMVIYNIYSVVVLQLSRSGFSGKSVLVGLKEIALNPLILASLAGLALIALGWKFWTPVDAALGLLADSAVPLALLGIGASLRPAHLEGRKGAVLAAATLKVAVLPLIGAAMANLFALDANSRLILLIFCATPTAAASYVVAVRMGGDAPLAGGTIFASTLLSAISLAVVLALAA